MPPLPRQVLSRPEFRFELHPCSFAHLPAIYEAAEESRANVSRWMGWLVPTYNLQNAENWVAHAIRAWSDGSAYEFIIHDRTDNAVVGCCGLNEIRRNDLFCNLGYWVRQSKLRLGAATQSVALLREFGLGPAGLHRIEIVAADGNQPSRGVAEKSGARYEGLLRSRMRIGDKSHDAHMYSFVRER